MVAEQTLANTLAIRRQVEMMCWILTALPPPIASRHGVSGVRLTVSGLAYRVRGGERRVDVDGYVFKSRLVVITEGVVVADDSVSYVKKEESSKRQESRRFI